jgi:cytochrome c553
MTFRLLSLLALLPACAAADERAGLELFEKRIRPALLNECVECHGAEKVKGGLRVDSREALRQGGDSGPAVVPGDAAKSLLLSAIKHLDPDLKMPSKAPKLDAALIADFERWISLGAPDPRDAPPSGAPQGNWAEKFAERKKWWCFQPITAPPPPPVKDTAWSVHPVDRFLLAKMEARGLTPVRTADAATLTRRLSYALTGLPPMWHRQTDLEALLASPHFGEHWARHWMDLVRYADTHGSEGDPEIPYAWRYRDYLITALNADVPWDQLIREHLAGDLLPQPRRGSDGRNESAIGTTHLRLVEHGFQPVDTLDEQVKTIDSQIDVLSKAFLGLTVSCARCHDHKFDAISQRDYYALYGVFANCRPATVTLDDPDKMQAQDAALEKLKAQIKARVAEAWQAEAQRKQAAFQPGAAATVRLRETEVRLEKISQEIAALETKAARGLAGLPATPLARWTFATGPDDTLSGLRGELRDGAVVRDGHLVLDGRKAHLRTAPLSRDLREKTLEAWVRLASLEQRGGGVIGIESNDGTVFDSIVFAEKEPRRWIAGSDFFRRGRNVGGAEETKANVPIHVAVVWHADGRIALYREGQPYGQPYTPEREPLVTFAAGQARVILGLRHTGGSNAHLRGEIDEARLYPVALEAAQIAASYTAGPDAGALTPERLAQALAPAELLRHRQLVAERQRAQAELAAQAADPAQRWATLRTEIEKDARHPLRALLRPQPTTTAASGPHFRPAWNLGHLEDFQRWVRHGRLPAMPVAAGDFSMLAEGARLFSGLLPRGMASHALSTRHHGVWQSPRFRVESDFISLHAAGGGGAQVRLICDGYPLGVDGIFPRAVLNQDEPRWLKLDVKYRRGTMAYLEFATRPDMTRVDGKTPENAPSWFAVDAVVFHDANATPPEAPLASDLSAAVQSWQNSTLTEPQRALLDALVRRELLPTKIDQLPGVAPLADAYRRLVAAMPVPQRISGVLEAERFDAPLLERGDHLQPRETVPRAFLAAIRQEPFPAQSARLALAEALTDPANPLTARVMVNRVWHWLFGRGLVPTPDNFGRMGEAPTHPELLDYLAAKFAAPQSAGGFGWSVKKLIRHLVTTRAFALASEPPPFAAERDGANETLAYFRTRRLGAESIRDTLLALAGQLETGGPGPGGDAHARPDQQRRRSVYLTVRRTALSPFLEVFDAPKPFSTLGRRDETNVPAQALTMMNDPLVIHCAKKWAMRHAGSARGERLEAMFREALGRPPGSEELARARAFLGPEETEERWHDFAHALLCAKELIYLH